MSIVFLILGYQQTQKMQEKAITSKLTNDLEHMIPPVGTTIV
jgi:hypothetical protein